MPDNKDIRAPHDKKRIDIDDPSEVANWCKSPQCSEWLLRLAVETNGTSADRGRGGGKGVMTDLGWRFALPQANMRPGLQPCSASLMVTIFARGIGMLSCKHIGGQMSHGDVRMELSGWLHVAAATDR